MKHTEAKALLGLLQAYFPQRALPESSVKLWANELQEHEAEDLRAAVEHLGRTAHFAPSLAELLEQTREGARWRQIVPELPEQASWSKEDEARSRELGVAILGEYNRKRKGVRA